MSISRCLVVAITEKNEDDKKFLERAAKRGAPEDIEVFFSPRGKCQEDVIEELGQAQKTLDIAMYTFTSQPIVKAVLEAKKRGCIVRVLLDDSMKTSKYSQAKALEEVGIPVKFDNHAGLMHDKFAVIDKKTVITGSYNWTKQAENKNDENMLVVHKEEIAEIYADKFEELWKGEDNDNL